MNITAEQIAALFDFPGIFEPALKSLLTAREIKAFTTQAVSSTGDAGADHELIDQGFEIIDFQRDRPRVEILFTPGAGQGQFRPLRISELQEIPIETSWSGQYKLDVITLPDIRAHREFVTAVRFIVHTQLYTLNGNILDKHRIQVDFKDAGSSPALEADKGSFQTVMLFDLDFSIQDDAWKQIEFSDVAPEPESGDEILDTGGQEILDTGGNPILAF